MDPAGSPGGGRRREPTAAPGAAGRGGDQRSRRGWRRDGRRGARAAPRARRRADGSAHARGDRHGGHETDQAGDAEHTVVLTSYEGPLLARSADSAGVYGSLVKGCSPEAIRDTVYQAWRHKIGLEQAEGSA